MSIVERFANAVDGETIQLPDAVVLFEPLKLSNVDKVTIQGPSKIRYCGPAGLAPLIVARCGYCKFKNIEIIVETQGMDSSVLITNLPGVSPTGRISTKNTFEDVTIGETPTPSKYGFSIDCRPLGGSDTNNEFHRFVDCRVRGFKKAAYHSYGSQAHGLEYERCSADGVDHGGKTGVYFEYGVNATLKNCNFNRVAQCVRTGGFHMRLVIDSMNSEHCKQLLSAGSDGNSCPTVVTNCRWDGTPMDDGTPVIDVFSMGPTTITGNLLNGHNGILPSIRAWCYQYQDPPGTLAGYQLGHAEITGNVLQGSNLQPGQLGRSLITAPASWEHSRLTGNIVIPWVDGTAGREQFAKVERLQ